ncbi:uncharacterized protein TNCV_2487471 [Trichonephila clavipes]|uniref:Uncharacterized protein n=1 Tax=Trichonephila clavipes TaxID=2585209 RepID=A0A8X6VZT3_TRICX|nr:uncharacterized protein TNCV_2487471 [Trichonephila clavipes]
MRICGDWMQEGTMDRLGRSHPPQCTTSREDRQNVRMSVTDRSVTSRTIAQHIESVIMCLWVPFDAVYIRVFFPQDVHCLVYPDVSAANGAMKEGCRWQNGMKLSLLTSHAFVCNTTKVGFESGDTVERG